MKKQHTWLHRQTLIGCEAIYVVFHSNFAPYIVCRRYKPCEFPGFLWTDCRGNKSYYVITSPANFTVGKIIYWVGNGQVLFTGWAKYFTRWANAHPDNLLFTSLQLASKTELKRIKHSISLCIHDSVAVGL